MWPTPLSAPFTRPTENRSGVWAYRCLKREITQLADDIHKKLVAVLELVLGLFAAMVTLVVFAATRMSKGITGPIVRLARA